MEASQIRLLRIIARATPNPDIGTVVRRANTGRETRSLTALDQLDEVLTERWFQCSHAEFEAAGEAEILVEQIKQAPLVRREFDAFRGRVLAEDETWTSMDFGPPPAHLATSQRYSRERQPALYLSDSPVGVQAEVAMRNSPSSPGEVLFIQRFKIDGAQLRIADLSDSRLPAFVHFAFERSEQTDDYLRSQIIADIVRAAGFDGMLVPGVRGSSVGNYKNAVVFNPEPIWREMLTKDSPFLARPPN